MGIKAKNKNLYDIMLIIKSKLISLLMKIIYYKFVKFTSIKIITNFPVIRGLNGSITLGKSVKFFGQMKIVFDDPSSKGNLIIGDFFTCEGATLSPRGGSVYVGNNCFIGENTIIQSFKKSKITIGNNVMIASHCSIFGSNHIFDHKNVLMNQQGEEAIGITIHDNVWIGTHCVLLDGITIGEGAIIAAGSVVNKDVSPYSIVGGIPGKTLKQR